MLAKHNIPLDKAWIVIWTTTTWTLPANVATCLNPNLEYAFVKIGDAYHIMARELVESTMKGCHIDEYEVLPETVLGSELELMQYQHPFLDRKGLVIPGRPCHPRRRHRLCPHRPGHGVEDFEVCVNHYLEVPVVVPVDDAGRLTAEAGEKFAGLKVWDANKVILEHIKESGHLMGVQHITHQYPHCWRCHHPIIFRATEQWFCSIDAFKEDVYKAIDSVHWQPPGVMTAWRAWFATAVTGASAVSASGACHPGILLQEVRQVPHHRCFHQGCLRPVPQGGQRRHGTR